MDHSFGMERSLTGRRWLWHPGQDDRIGLAIAQRLDLPEMVGRLLAGRGIGLESAADFLTPTLRALLPDPSSLMDMDEAAERLARAVRAGETVGIFGDYDVDGACSTAIMALLLRGLGCRVLPHIPDRIREGYGPNAAALLDLAEAGATLVVCVDCGTAAGEILDTLRGRADVIVLDHHKAEGPLPPVLATVNPNRLDCHSGLGGSCAAAIAFLAGVAMVRVLRKSGQFASSSAPDLLALLDLVALATVCDVMPLTGLNRALVAQGLRVMGRRARPGIAALLEVAAARDVPTAMMCGFALGPRINAAGRIGDASMGLRLLTTADPVEARALAQALDEINRERQDVERGILDAAMVQAEAQVNEGRAVLLLAGDGWHPGVVGIIAGRVRERFNRPALVGAREGGLVKGSGRSVPGLDLGGAIIAAREAGLLATGGGHAMAAGFSLPETGLAALHGFVEARLAAASALPQAADLAIEGSVSVAGATLDLARHLQRLAPFGAGNEEPMLVVSRARIVKSDRLGREGTTIRAWLEGESGGARLKSLLFRAGPGAGKERLAEVLSAPGPALHLAGHLRAEEWNGTVSTSFAITDVTLA